MLDLGYGYGPLNNGRIRTRTDTLQPEHSAQYSYDPMNRLAGVSGTGTNWGISWDLDSSGNRRSQTPSGLAVSKVGQQTSGYTNNRNDALGYDDAGDVTNDGLHAYAYDAEGRITMVDGGAVTFAYDDQGRHIRKSAGSVTTYYFYGLTGLMSEFTTTPGAAGSVSTDRLQYRVAEQTGTSVLLVSSAGAVLENNRVLPYSELWSNFVNSSNDQKFTTYDRGNPLQSDAELDYAMARFHGNRYGRFTSPDRTILSVDATNPQSWHKYLYAMNDPINFIDPSGSEIQDVGNGCTWNTSTNTLTCPNGGSTGGPIIGAGPGGCLDIVVDGILLGNTCAGGPSIGPDSSRGTGNTTPRTGSLVGIRTPGQTFSQCMKANANTYSIGGTVDLFASVVSGRDVSVLTSPLGGFLTGNSINAFLFGSSSEAATAVYGTFGTDIATVAMGSTVTYGRRTAAVAALNLVGRTGPAPRILQTATTGAKSALGTLGRITNAGLTLTQKLTIDVAFTAGEVISCSFPQ